MAKSPTSNDTQGLSPAVYEELQRLRDLIRSDTVKRELWANRFTAADRQKFTGPVKEVRKQHHAIELWHIARGTPTPNQCIVEAAYAVGLINDSRRESLLDALGAQSRAKHIANQRSAAVPHWDEDARELRFRGKVVRVVKRPKQAHNIVKILRAFEATGWPPRIDDPHGRKSSDETRRRDMSNLKQGLETSLMKFECDGDGTGFLWKKIPQPKAVRTAKRRKR
jgi:hypothetical protein